MSKKKYLSLPKPYLSYSQVELWKHDKTRYRHLYFANNKLFNITNSGLEYGKIVAESLEYERETGDLLTDSAMLLLEKYDVRDKEIMVELKSKYGWFSIIGRPDTLNSMTKAFREYKTGRNKWTQEKAQKHPQMVFYAMLIYLKYGVVLSEAYLDWIETEEVDETFIDEDGFDWGKMKKVKPTGRVEHFKVTFSLGQILQCMAETIKIAEEIELDFASYTTPNKI